MIDKRIELPKMDHLKSFISNETIKECVFCWNYTFLFFTIINWTFTFYHQIRGISDFLRIRTLYAYIEYLRIMFLSEYFDS